MVEQQEVVDSCKLEVVSRSTADGPQLAAVGSAEMKGGDQVAKKGVPRGTAKQNKHHDRKPSGHKQHRKQF